MSEDIGIEEFPLSDRGKVIHENVAICMRHSYWITLSPAVQEFCIDMLCKDPHEVTIKQFNRLHNLANPEHWAGSELERSEK